MVPFPSQSPSFPYTSPAKPSQTHSFPPTNPDEHHPTPETFFQSSLFPFSRFPQHSHPLCTPTFPLYTPWRIMPRSLASPSALLPHLDMMSQIFLLYHFLRSSRPLCGICFSFLQRILTHQNFAGVRHLTRGRHLLMSPTRLCLCRRSRHGRRRLFAFNLSLLRQKQHF